MTNQLEALIADMKAAAEKANQANELYLDGKIRLSECSAEIKDYLDYSDDPKNMLALIAALEREREKSRRVMSQLEASQLAVKLPEEFAVISENLRTQDNRITDQPMFVIFEKREIIGSDEHNPSRIAWCRDGEEVSELKAKRLEALHQEYRATNDYDRYAMQEIDVFVTACFTEQGCKDYLELNGHNLRQPYIFAAGSYRNNEYQTIRNWLMHAGITVQGDE